MASQDAFDPHTFLAHVGAGRTLTTYRPQSTIFAQGDDADAVFYIQRGQVKLTVVSAQGKEGTDCEFCRRAEPIVGCGEIRLLPCTSTFST